MALAAALPTGLRAQEVLLTDDFTADMNVRAGALDFNIANRQTGTLATTDYMTFPGGNPNVQLGNMTTMRSGGDGNYLLLAFGGIASLNQNLNGPLTAQGLEISFDVAANLDTSTPAVLNNWTAINIGSAPDERNISVNSPRRHFGFLFRANGLTQAFERTTLISTDIPWSPMQEGGVDNFDRVRMVITDPTDGNPFDGTGVTKIEVFSSLIDGGESPIYSYTKEGGGFADNYLSFVSNSIGAIDELEITSAPERVELDESFLYTPIAENDAVGQLAVVTDAAAENYTFELVAGNGATDNDKFTVSGSVLRAGAYDFLLDPEGTSYRVRVRATGDTSGAIFESVVALTKVIDGDGDRISDTYEMAFGVDLTATGNLDGDGLTDFEEYAISRGPFPTISPITEDSDGDTLEDSAEYFGTLGALPTNPTAADTDGDVYRDDYEIANATDPTNAGSRPPLPAGLTVIPVTDDASSEVGGGTVYTHTISGGGPATINGVLFEELNPGSSLANFVWSASFSQNEIDPINNGDWLPGNGNVNGSGLLDLFGGFTFSSTGADPGSTQIFTLSGLTPGRSYDFRFYIRIWDTAGSGRPIELTFTNGASSELISPPGGFPEDRPQFIPGLTDQHQAYILSYPYTAESSEVSVTAAVPLSAAAGSGSFHMYGLSNQVVGDLEPFAITSIARDPASGGVTLIFPSSMGETFDIEVSEALEDGTFVPLAQNIDAAPGATTSFTDTALAPTRDALYYRVRRQ